MKKLGLLFILLFAVSCQKSGAVDKPKNLIEPDQMATIIAEFAVSEQVNYQSKGGDLETTSRYVLASQKVTATEFQESYNYYIASPRVLEKILVQAQQIVAEKDPKAKSYIEKKLKEVGSVPIFAR